MATKLEKQKQDLKAFNIQHKLWLVLSIAVIATVGFLFFDRAYLEEHHLLWATGAAGIVTSIVWWYWAMQLISKVLDHRLEEIEVLEDLGTSILEIKEIIRTDIDKDK